MEAFLEKDVGPLRKGVCSSGGDVNTHCTSVGTLLGEGGSGPADASTQDSEQLG